MSRQNEVAFRSESGSASLDGWSVLSGELREHDGGWEVLEDSCLQFLFPGGGALDYEVSLELERPEDGGALHADSGTAHFGMDFQARIARLIPIGEDMEYAYGLEFPQRMRLAFSAQADGFRLDWGGGVGLSAPNRHPDRDHVALELALPKGARFRDLACRWAKPGSSGVNRPLGPKFAFHATVDFYDDLIHSEEPWTPDTFDNLMAFHARQGASRVYWIYHGEDGAHGFWDNIELHDLAFPGLKEKMAQTRRNVPRWLGQAAASAHKHGMECVAVVKPFDMGPGWGVVPDDAPPAWKRAERIHGWSYWATDLIVRHPGLREERCLEGIDPADARPVGRIRLVKDDARPFAFDPRQIEIYVSDSNRDYRPYRGPLEIVCQQETVQEHAYFPTPAGRERAGLPRTCTVITLGNLHIPEKFVLLKTGTARSFGNRLFRLVEMADKQGNEIPFEYGLIASLRSSPASEGEDPRKIGFSFCQPRGGGVPARENALAFLDPPLGMLGFARGKERYLAGYPFIGHEEVQEYLLQWVGECLQAGADGVDFRIANHNRTFEWSAFGFQEPVRRAFLERHGVDIPRDPFRLEDLRRLRGEFYTEFLRKARRFLSSRGKKMQLHVNPHFSMSDPSGRLYNEILYDGEAWLREGLADAITLKTSALRPVTDNQRAVVKAAHTAGVPVYACPYLNGTLNLAGRAGYYEALVRSHKEEGMDGHVLYENAAMVRAGKGGAMECKAPDYFRAVARHIR